VNAATFRRVVPEICLKMSVLAICAILPNRRINNLSCFEDLQRFEPLPAPTNLLILYT
jgi:hypothetical protein